MHKLKVGIIGVGMAFERLHYPAFQKLKDKFEIVALCDPDGEKAEKWCETLELTPDDVYTDYRDIIKRKDIDAFDIMVPIESNFEVTKKVAKAGKPIIAEKPLAPTREQAKAAKDLTEKYKIPIMIAENYRYNEENNIIRDLVRTKEIGDVYYFIQNRVIDFPEDMLGDNFAAKEWRQHPEFPGGVFFDTGVHDIAAIRHIFGGIDTLHAFAVPQEADFSPYSVVQANIEFHSGVIGQFSFFTSGKEMQRPLIGLRIFGSNGMIYLEESNCGIINIAYNNGESKTIPYEPNMGFYNELLNFYKASTGEEVIAVTPEMEYGDAETIFAILESVKTNRVITVDPVAEYELV